LDYKHVSRTDYAFNPRFYCTACPARKSRGTGRHDSNTNASIVTHKNPDNSNISEIPEINMGHKDDVTTPNIETTATATDRENQESKEGQEYSETSGVNIPPGHIAIPDAPVSDAVDTGVRMDETGRRPTQPARRTAVSRNKGNKNPKDAELGEPDTVPYPKDLINRDEHPDELMKESDTSSASHARDDTNDDMRRSPKRNKK
jgi:hypothetical protein